jgi:hypothetical protein
MAVLGETTNAIIITIFLLVTTWTLSYDISNAESSLRERRALVFPSGTVLQVRLNILSSA